MLRNVLVTTACLLTAAVASAQQPTHKSSTIPASHPVPVVASQHARVPATVVARKEAATTTRAERKAERAAQKSERAEQKSEHAAQAAVRAEQKTERAVQKEARTDSTQARSMHHAKSSAKAKATKAHRKGMKHEAKHDSSAARKGR